MLQPEKRRWVVEARGNILELWPSPVTKWLLHCYRTAAEIQLDNEVIYFSYNLERAMTGNLR